MAEEKMQFTEEEKREKIKRELDKNFFVEAGAGAGKTTLLSERIVTQIKVGIAPEAIAAITYTNKAAQELKDRIVKKVHEELGKGVKGTKEYDNLRKAEENIQCMQISTIHGFCHRLLEEQAFSAKLPLDVRVLEEEENRQEKERFFYASYAEQEIERLRKDYKGNAKEATKSVFMQICELPEDTEIMYHKELLSKTNAEYEAEAQICYDTFRKDIVYTFQKETQSKVRGIENIKLLKSFQDTFKQPAMEYAQKMKFGINMFAIHAQNGIEKRVDGQRVSSIIWDKESAKQLFELGKEYKAYQHALVVEVAEKIRNSYWKQRKKGVSSISNDALIQRACKLVCEQENVWKYFKNKYTSLYVDEFQDTDHIQAKMILQLCREEFGKATLRKGSLFVVGDVKQSIYRFRGADLYTFGEIRAFAESQNNFYVFQLAYNYRSHASIVQWINQEFQPKMGIKYQSMTAIGRKEKMMEKDGACLEGVYYVEDMNQVQKIEKKQKSTADEIVQLCNMIKNMVEKNTLWDEELGRYRSVIYSDFLVLCNRTGHMEEYVREFQNRGIPVNVAGKVDIKKDKILIRFARLYRYLAYPYGDRLAREGAMQEVLRTLVLEEKQFQKDETLDKEQKSVREKFAEQRLERLKEETANMFGSELAIYLLHHLEYILDWNRELSAMEIVMEQKRLYQMVEQVVSKNIDSPQVLEQAFFDYIQHPVEKELSLEYQEDAIRFMNVHKAKGLEGHIVILVDRCATRDREQSFQRKKIERNLYEYEFYPSYSIGLYNASVGYYMDEEIWNLAKMEENEEQIRLEYVAATRAMDVLIIMSPLTASNCFFKGYGNISGSVCAKRLEEIDNNILKSPINEKDNSTSRSYKEYDQKAWNCKSEMEQESLQYLDISPSALEQKVQMNKENSMKEERPDGNVFGTVMHRAFELLIKYWKKVGDKTIGEMSACIAPSITQAIMESLDEIQMVNGGQWEDMTERYRKFLEEKLKEYIHDKEIGSLLEASKAVYTELPFSVWTTKKKDPLLFEYMQEYLARKKMMPKENQDVWIHGIADLVCLTKDNTIKIIDYKSDKKGNESEKEFSDRLYQRYNGQLKLYECIMKKLFPEVKKVESKVYHLYR